jgi:hypothetical protein
MKKEDCWEFSLERKTDSLISSTRKTLSLKNIKMPYGAWKMDWMLSKNLYAIE